MVHARSGFTIAAVLAVVAIGVYAFVVTHSGYRVKLVLPSAAQLVTGSPVWVNGLEAGSVKDLSVEDGKAVVEVSIDKQFAPLREGATSWIEWYSAVGERVVFLRQGPPEAAAIPDGGVYAPQQTKQIELDDVLAALDPPTRARLNSLIGELNMTVAGREKEFQATLNTAGPAVSALGGVLESVGRDGPAIKELVKKLNEVTSIATKHRNDVAATVTNLTTFTGPLAQQQDKITETLKELPPTLQVAQDTLNDVPPAVDATNPLLQDLRPGTDRLASVSKNLNGLLDDLRPAVNDLRPTLGSLRGVLDKTPEFLDRSHDILPPVHHITERYGDAVSFLRPYTPELVGWLQNFGLSFSAYDSQGHYWSTVLGQAGPNAVGEHVTNPPLSNPVKQPAPGALVGQPWTDAWGSKGN
jgi:phospholipid/cholesterol/gamma-HCH transport system substrate-binding protein